MPKESFKIVTVQSELSESSIKRNLKRFWKTRLSMTVHGIGLTTI